MSACDRIILTLALLAASPVLAEAPLTAEEFDAFSVGKTLDYAVDGVIYGSESYLPERRVIDADIGGPCRPGRWEPHGDQICFIYDGSTALHCWRFWRRGDGLLAEITDSPPDAPPITVTIADTPLACAGPDVGV
jgi:hypothetical protein